VLNRIVPAFLIVQLMLARFFAGADVHPPIPDPARFPLIDHWQMISDDGAPADLREQLGADMIVNRTYARVPPGLTANVFVSWYQWQQEGMRQPHSPQICLPSGGWLIEREAQSNLASALGPITVNRFLVRNGTERAVMLYWYQTPHRVVAGEWAAKFWRVSEAVWSRRTDVAFVRVFIPFSSSAERDADSSAESLAAVLAVGLREYLPR
jgi:EpsI family protein